MVALRESALLPTIKCSSCGLQVEISLMGDHLCSGPSAELSPPPDSNEKFNGQPFNRPPERHGRVPAPVDTGAANRAFMNQGQLTPVSQPGESRNVSPITPSMRAIPGQQGDYFVSGNESNEGSTRTPPYLRRPDGPGSLAEGFDDGRRPSIAIKPIGEALMERMNGMAPGPFDTSRRPSVAGGHVFPTRNVSLEKWEGPIDESPNGQNWGGTGSSSTSPGINAPLMTPKQPKKNNYEGFGPPPSTPRDPEAKMGSLSRSETYPKSSSAIEASRRPSVPNPQPTLLPPMSAPCSRRPSLGPDTTRRPPPRTSLMPQEVDPSSVDLAAEFGSSNPYHTPSESSSSGFSTFSAQSQASSQSSLAPSDFRGYGFEDHMNAKMDYLHISTERLRPMDLRIDPNVPMRNASSMPSSPYAISPMDMRPEPAMSREPPGGYRPYTRPPPSPRYDASPMNDLSPGRAVTPPRGPPLLRKVSQDPSNMPSRGDCKACHLPITGKSISSADGRLTGKYHKACFVCATCSEPFSSAEFYVLDDRPYCEQHYHGLNGSLCGGCGRGIEGQFVEDESRIKHHVDCFCCLDCGMSLSGGYFEVDGKAYCERDALRRTQPSPQPSPISPGGAMSFSHRPYQPGPPRMGPGHGPGHPYANGPGPRPYGGPPHRPMGPGGPGPRPGYGPPSMGPPGMQRGPYGGPSPGRLGPGMGPRPTMNKRMTRLGMM
ncbi:Paxillin-like protein 1 [Cladobotryum mycophilum]|uniref:Paxillin-like protein 1 n=1 Tax=Cladobotryum mycophilum TaxID=491253 RepID=A0ABR0S6A8_9HYPO